MRKLLGATLVIALAACSGPTISSSATFAPQATPAGSPGSSPGLSPGVLPTASPPAASTAPSAPPVSAQVFPPGAAVEVAVRELNVRRNPSTSSKRLEILDRGTILVISPIDSHSLGWGPVQADGYTWYPVVRPDVSTDGQLDPLPKPPIRFGDDSLLAGWVASHDGSREYLAPIGPRCPTTVDLLNVSGMLPAERLACFGEPFVLEGTYGCPACGGISTMTSKPAWLANPFEFDLLSMSPAEQLGPLALRFPPDGPSRPAIGSIIRVTVHVDDARATKCTLREHDGTGGTVEIDARSAVLYCRERLVVDALEVLGTDPSFPPG